MRPSTTLPWASAATAFIASIVGGRYVAGAAWRGGFPLDDAWIHMVYGLALRTEGSLAYNPGHPATGATSPLWAVLAGFAHALAGADGPSLTAAAWLKALGLALHGATAAAAASLATHASRDLVERRALALAAGLACAAHPSLLYASVSGMEVSLASLLPLVALIAATRGAATWSGVFAGVAVIARPEALVALPIVAACVAWYAPGPRARAVARFALAAAVPVLALAARNFAVSGRPLPATFYAKFGTHGVGWVESITRQWRHSLRVTPVVGTLPFASVTLVGAVAAARRAPAVTAAAGVALLWILGSSIAIPPTHPSFYFHRYVLPTLPMLLVAAVVGLATVVRGLESLRPAWRVLAFCAVATTFVGYEIAALPAARRDFAAHCGTIDALNVGTGRLIDASLARDAVVWTIDAGGARYWGRRRTVDLLGLNTPELVARVRVPEAWWPDAIATIPGFFRVRALREAMSTVGDLRAPYTLSNAPDLGRHVLYQCRADRAPTVLDELAVVSRRGEFLALGRCRPVAR